ncbi:MAG: hypothetical protein JO110_27215, partial [Acetobacteraceae bacterium]|nr:hypothetical protein [Acetobacteraceae bacterium]
MIAAASRVAGREDSMTRFAFTAFVTSGLLLAAGPGAYAQNKSCSTTMSGNVIHGNLVVPPDATCTLNGVTVDGNISVGTGATLNVSSGSRIGGNIQASGCNFVSLFPGPISIGGNVDINSCNGGQNGYQAAPSGSPQPPSPGG